MQYTEHNPGCSGKDAYETHEAAIDAILSMKKRRRHEARRRVPNTRHMVTYHCEYCGKWHIGIPRSVKKKF